MVDEAIRHPFEQLDRPVGMAQQQGTGIRGDRPAVETRDHATVFKCFELS